MNTIANRCNRRLALATLLVWLSTWMDVGAREHFHRLYSYLDSMAWLALVPLLIVAEWSLVRFVRGGGGQSAHRWAHYFLMAVALWFWVAVHGGAVGNKFKTAFIVATCLYGAVSIVLRVRPWWRDRFVMSRWPIAITAAICLFVATPPVLVAYMATPVHWPDISADAANQHEPSAFGPRPTVVVLLFDELEYRAAEPIRQVLFEEGLAVSARSVQPAGDRTAKVVPAMFTRQSFEEARVCGWSSICSGRQMLSFSEIDVTWPDVDVVGFYLPYCSMKGLRWCRRESPSPAVADAQRLSCAVRHRLGMNIPTACSLNQHAAWTALVQRVEESYWQAPIWKQGGMLYAHLPIPHPPGTDAKASLVDHYRSGVDQAALLVRETVRKLKESSAGAFQIVVTSDHPLRVSMWCTDGTYSKQRCAGAEKLKGEGVPLMVGSWGSAAPALSRFTRNDQLFDLVTELRRRGASARMQ